MELEKTDKILVNFRILKTILELYIDKNEVDTLNSWYDYYGYKTLIKDVLADIHLTKWPPYIVKFKSHF